MNSVTCFARCHHGYIYYDTKQFPERTSPAPARGNLLEGADRRLPHARHPRADLHHGPVGPVHRRRRTRSGGRSPRRARSRARRPTSPASTAAVPELALPSTSCKQHLAEHLRARSPSTGSSSTSSPRSATARARSACARWRQRASTPTTPSTGRPFGAGDHRTASSATLTAYIRALDRRTARSSTTAATSGPTHRRISTATRTWSSSRCPSGGWGYLHFPLSMRYARTLGLDCLGMTGKFHTSWGDFHSLKNRAALRVRVLPHARARGEVLDRRPAPPVGPPRSGRPTT